MPSNASLTSIVQIYNFFTIAFDLFNIRFLFSSSFPCITTCFFKSTWKIVFSKLVHTIQSNNVSIDACSKSLHTVKAFSFFFVGAPDSTQVAYNFSNLQLLKISLSYNSFLAPSLAFIPILKMSAGMGDHILCLSWSQWTKVFGTNPITLLPKIYSSVSFSHRLFHFWKLPWLQWLKSEDSSPHHLLITCYIRIANTASLGSMLIDIPFKYLDIRTFFLRSS